MITSFQSCSYVAFFFTQFSLNVVFSAQCALPADLQENKANDSVGAAEDITGLVSSYVGLYVFLGSLGGLGTAFTITTDLSTGYYVQIFFLLLTCFILCYSAPEKSSEQLQLEPFTLKEVLECYTLTPATDKNFLWVCMGRVFFYLSTSPVCFLYYFVRDTFDPLDEADVKRKLAFILVSSLVIGAITTGPAAKLSNKIGRKLVIYFACCCIALSAVSFMVVPAAHWMVLFSVMLYGVGHGAYMSVDYALALQCLPQSKKPAEAFGLWGVAGFIGSAVGPVSGGIILSFYRSDGNGVNMYDSAGYSLLWFLMTVCNSILVALSTHQIADGE